MCSFRDDESIVLSRYLKHTLSAILQCVRSVTTKVLFMSLCKKQQTQTCDKVDYLTMNVNCSLNLPDLPGDSQKSIKSPVLLDGRTNLPDF